ncbi:FlxA-like family protein [Azonexus sp.]|jgi:TolA-binding protein|uniref:FlxA-like family protein n=1 Tax=Azonexus sp. TaxID=1872668 RepID=UPI0028192668|nr:FlxA-like family protein [Azonexus sp.]MDR1996071.1 FlxA-like family protein [Azonexus sp.]
MSELISSTASVSILASLSAAGLASAVDHVAAIRKHIESLHMQLLRLQEGGSEDAVKQAELIQQQISMLQVQLAQLQAEQQQAVLEAQQNQEALGATLADGASGFEVDVFV